MSDRILTPIIAVGLALLIWLYMRSRDQEVIDNYAIPVEVSLASTQLDHYEMDVEGPSEVRVSFSGPPSRLRELRGLLQKGEIRVARTVSVPDERSNDARYVDVLRIDASEVHVPAGVRAIITEKHNRVPITLRRIVEKSLPVKLNHTAGDRIERVAIEPSTVTIRGPKELVDREEYLGTQLYSVPARFDKPLAGAPEVIDSVGVSQELNGRGVKVTPGRVQLRLTLRPQQKIHELADVRVHFLCPSPFAHRPQFTSPRAGFVTLKVKGPATEQPPAVRAYIDVSSFTRPGLYAEETVRVQLPPGFELAQDPPKISVELVPVPLPGKPVEIGLNP
jgi:hypothetical protein